MSNAHEHLEHAEHAEHLAGDPFNQRVAVSVAVVAALLAGISMLGHRKHNEVLQLQGEANRLTAEGSIFHTQATDKWGEYQAVNIRDHGYEFAGNLLREVSKTKPDLEPALKGAVKRADDQHNKYKDRLPTVQGEAKKLTADGEDKVKGALARMDEAHHAHAQANLLDFGHLGAEIGIVLCSLALLTKRKAFWLAGLAAAVVAIGLVVWAHALPYHPHEPGPAHAQTHA